MRYSTTRTIAIWTGSLQIQVTEMGGQSRDRNLLARVLPAVERRGSDPQIRAVLERKQLAEQVDPLGIGPEVRLIASGNHVGSSLLPS